MINELLKLVKENTDGFKEEDSPNVRDSLSEAIEENQILALTDKNRNFVGFVTWELKNSIREGLIVIGVTNLIILPKYRKTVNLKKIKTFFLKRYDNIYSICWENRKRKRFFKQLQSEISYV